MSSEIVVAILAMLGTMAGSIIGAFTSSKLSAYRLDKLDKSVEDLTKILERVAVVERDVKSAHKRIDDILL